MDEEKTALGLTPNLTAALAYALWMAGGIVIFLLEKNNKFVRFHAMQSIIMFGSLLVVSIALGFIPVLGFVLNIFMPVVVFVCWVYGILKAIRGEYYKFPIVGDIAEKQI